MKRNRKLLLLTFLGIFVGIGQAETIARVMKSNGDVKVKTMGSSSFNKAAKPGLAINNGDAMRVGESGFAVVIFIDDRSVVKVRENTEFQFIETSNTRTLQIDQGTILNNINKEGRTKNFRVETPVSVASVKGTEFAAIVNPAGVDNFIGKSGNFDVTNQITGQTVNVGAGQKAISNSMGNLMQAPAAPGDYPEDPETGFQEEPEEEAEEEESEEDSETQEEIEESEEVDEKEEIEETEEPEDSEEQSAEKGEDAGEPDADTKDVPDKPFDLGLGVGSVTIDGVLYNQLALRPEFKIGKLGIGLDLALYIDNAGEIRKDEWDEASDYIDKFLFIRWGEKEDPFWVKWGSMDNVTLGYGGLLSGYSNMMEFPSIRRIGINTGVNFGKMGAEVFLSNIKDFSRGGTLMGLRGSYTVSKKFPLRIGANFVMDMNQFSGMSDKDDDSYPDIFDDFPDDVSLWNDTDGDGFPDPHPGLDSSLVDIDANGNNVVDANETNLGLKGTPFSIEDNKASVTGYAVDIGYPVLKGKVFKLDIYAEFNFLNFPEAGTQDSSGASTFYRPARSGSGFSVPGIRASVFSFLNFSFEFRMKSGYYVPQFFDQSYDITRVTQTFVDEQASIYTKDMLLFADSTMNEDLTGFYGSMGADVFGFASITGAYANMTSETDTVKSFTASININAEKIPKLSEAMVYYQRNNDSNPFDFANPSVNTVLGYRLGYEVSSGVSLIWDFKQFYRDDGTGSLEPVKMTTIETAFTF
ncbi:MAG: FecR domain-containing protein [Candidatus Marinimicrobia bacterium]|jgi:hypothetical protein|nr:FecR domain-containing protein [Candidatus Neomarinimicrobiota bacterium]MBT3618285.1 FecR domain-containing protein [Candidatus Neomarinimicrobiota bacterium]MBT3828230.1 FecR domain-containing protein [Candidatus Neomarinimicrobiota bacterium]MBT3997147.1 FecR domain-containing protein [Candidatus Neomarinimicrobiota bacterium]MBT4280613.1 FecR domain-containing protein [Candidatus Neomarinimicrobiota bacterium]